MKRQQDVKNQDLRKPFLSLMKILQGKGVKILFWRIPRACNERADRFAKYEVEKMKIPHFVMVQPDGPTDIKFKSYPYQALKELYRVSSSCIRDEAHVVFMSTG